MADRLLNKRWPWLTAAALVVIAYLSTFVELRIGRPDSREVGSADDIERLAERDDVNLLFILIDTLRSHHIHSYGYERATSPILDHLAARGVRFANHLAQSSWTKCSMASLWTGLYPQRAGVTRFDHVLPQEARMPAEILRDAGFRTTGLWRNGWVEGYHGFDQGFELYERPVGRPPPPSVRRENPTVKGVGSDTDSVDAAIEFLRVHGDERWFLYLHFMDVHEYLYDEDTAVFGTGYADVYDNSILRMNRTINQLLVHLSEVDLLDKTLIVISSDHGEAFGERGFEGHARKVYLESTQVPLILSFPFALEPGVVVEQRTRNVDIWPTLLELLGLPPMQGVDGRSRVPEMLAAARGHAPPEQPPDAGYAHLDQNWGQRNRRPMPTLSVLDDRFRYVLTKRAGEDLEELFDGGADPREPSDVIGEQPEVAERMRELASAYLDSKPPWKEEVKALELDEVQLNQLRALGYKVP